MCACGVQVWRVYEYVFACVECERERVWSVCMHVWSVYECVYACVGCERVCECEQMM